jgi:hypothetical protein
MDGKKTDDKKMAGSALLLHIGIGIAFAIAIATAIEIGHNGNRVLR